MLFSSDIPNSAIYGIVWDAGTGQEAVNSCVLVKCTANQTFSRYKSRKLSNFQNEIQIPDKNKVH
jgi:hypothetical protein